MPNNKPKEAIDHVDESLLGIRFRKSFYADNTMKYFVNDEEVTAFTAALMGKHKRELIITIISKVDE